MISSRKYYVTVTHIKHVQQYVSDISYNVTVGCISVGTDVFEI